MSGFLISDFVSEGAKHMLALGMTLMALLSTPPSV